MNKRIFTSITSLLMCTCLLFGMSACAKENKVPSIQTVDVPKTDETTADSSENGGLDNSFQTNDVLKKIFIVQKSLNIKVGEAQELTAELVGFENPELVWVSSDPAVATVSESGRIEGKISGDAIVTVTVKNSEIFAQCAVKVTENDSSAAPLHTTHDFKEISRSKECGVGISAKFECSVCGKEKSELDTTKEAKACEYENGRCKLCGDTLLGTLLYSQNFDNLDESLSQEQLLKALGWTIDGKKYGAYADNTASYKVVNSNGEKSLYIENYASGKTGLDSYVEILSKEQFGIFHEENFTYQYDIKYAASSATDRFIALVSDYNGGSYISFHLRNRGTANHQTHSDDVWTHIGDGNVNAIDENSLATKLLGKTYDVNTSAFKNVSFSIRYVVDWKDGNRVYVRINDTSYENSGKWILVSKMSAEDMKTCTSEIYGKGFALKVGGAQNGYVDNIYVWSGTEENIPKSFDGKAQITEQKCYGHKREGDSCEFCGKLMLDGEYKSYEMLDEYFEKDTDQTISAYAERIKLVDGIGDYYVPQGGCTDGKYIYFAFENQKLAADGSTLSGSEYNKKDHYAKIVKIDIATWEIVKISEPLVLNHCNDMTYVPKLKQLIVLNNAPNGKTFSYVDAENLTLVKTALSTDLVGQDLDNHYAIGYCPEREQYAIGKSGTYDTVVLREDYSLNSMLYCPNPTGYTKQGLDCDQEYIYYVQYKENVVMIYDWSGNFVSRISIKNVNMEPEFIFHIGDDFYIGAYGYSQCVIYKLTLGD